MTRTAVVLTDFFLPSDKAGGPVRSMAELATATVAGRVLFVAGDRDLGDSEPFPDLVVGRPVRVLGAEVVYLPADRARSILTAWRLLRSVQPDTVYLNTLFAPVSGLLPLLLHRARLLHSGLLVVAPRGQLDPGAMSLSAGRKRAVLRVVRRLGGRADVRFHATSELERRHILQVLPDAEVRVLPPVPAVRWRQAPPTPVRTPLRLVYVSRVSPKKGLLVALEALRLLEVPVALDVHGPEEDVEYSTACRRLAETLGPEHQVRFLGPIAHEQVTGVLEAADALVLPTLGENFGHVVLESLASGCPPVLGSATPWTGSLKAGAGWAVDATSPRSVADALEQLAALTPEEAAQRSRAAVAAARRYVYEVRNGHGWDALLWP